MNYRLRKTYNLTASVGYCSTGVIAVFLFLHKIKVRNFYGDVLKITVAGKI